MKNINVIIGVVVIVLVVMVLSAPLSNITGQVVSPEVASLYSKFTCTACGGKSIGESESLTALGMREYIQGLSLEFSGDGLFLEAVKRFGLQSLIETDLKESTALRFEQSPPEGRPTISASPMDVNLGNTTQAAGVILSMFTMENRGESDLIITDLKTSCSCMFASFLQDGEESPRVGRFSTSQGWSITIEPGESAKLWVYYDPRVNGWFTGRAVRWIYITSNDPLNPMIQIRIEHYQVDKLQVAPER